MRGMSGALHASLSLPQALTQKQVFIKWILKLINFSNHS